MSKFFNGNKRAEIQKTDYGYSVNFYIDNKFTHKQNVGSLHSAEDLAEDFVLEGDSGGPTLLNENA